MEVFPLSSDTTIRRDGQRPPVASLSRTNISPDKMAEMGGGVVNWLGGGRGASSPIYSISPNKVRGS